MKENELSKRYFDWMYRLVFNCGYAKPLSYRKLLLYLYQTPFTFSIPMDENRYADGINLRYRFGDDNRVSQAEIATYLDTRPCSVLEMMLALAIRCEESIMSDPEIGDRTGQWFWNMIVSLHLGTMNDRRFDLAYTQQAVARFLNRAYKPNGEGGLFTLEHCRYDLREVEIWYQAMWYLDTYFE